MQKSNEWYFVRDGQSRGPVTLAQLQAAARSGELQPTDKVWVDPMPNWVAAGSLAEIFAPGRPAAAASATVPPPPLPRTSAPTNTPPIGYAGPATEPKDIGQDAGMRMLIPVGRSGWAIAAGYLGLLSVIPIFAPLALIFGWIAIRDIRRNPQKHGMGRAIFGIVMGGLITLAVVGGIGFLILDEMGR